MCADAIKLQAGDSLAMKMDMQEFAVLSKAVYSVNKLCDTETLLINRVLLNGSVLKSLKNVDNDLLAYEYTPNLDKISKLVTGSEPPPRTQLPAC